MKKGESISMSVIIIAAIALLVLVVLAVLVLRSGNSIASGTGCSGQGGTCKAECDPDNEQALFTFGGKANGCTDSAPVCCKQKLINEPQQ